MQMFAGKKPDIIILLGLLLHGVLAVIAMALYPGGHIYDLNSIGYSFSQNYFSDMGHSVSLSGEDNLLSRITFVVSMLFFMLAQFIFYLTEYVRNIHKPIGNKVGSAFGLISLIGIILLIVFPNDTHRSLHVFGVYIWTLSFLVYVLFYIYFHSSTYKNPGGVVFISIPLYILVSLQLLQNELEWYQYMALTQKIMVYYMLSWFVVATLIRRNRPTINVPTKPSLSARNCRR